jgi:hypothetical protein
MSLNLGDIINILKVSKENAELFNKIQSQINLIYPYINQVLCHASYYQQQHHDQETTTTTFHHSFPKLFCQWLTENSITLTDHMYIFDSDLWLSKGCSRTFPHHRTILILEKLENNNNHNSEMNYICSYFHQQPMIIHLKDIESKLKIASNQHTKILNNYFELFQNVIFNIEIIYLVYSYELLCLELKNSIIHHVEPYILHSIRELLDVPNWKLQDESSSSSSSIDKETLFDIFWKNNEMYSDYHSQHLKINSFARNITLSLDLTTEESKEFELNCEAASKACDLSYSKSSHQNIIPWVTELFAGVARVVLGTVMFYKNKKLCSKLNYNSMYTYKIKVLNQWNTFLNENETTWNEENKRRSNATLNSFENHKNINNQQQQRINELDELMNDIFAECYINKEVEIK